MNLMGNRDRTPGNQEIFQICCHNAAIWNFKEFIDSHCNNFCPASGCTVDINRVVATGNGIREAGSILEGIGIQIGTPLDSPTFPHSDFGSHGMNFRMFKTGNGAAQPVDNLPHLPTTFFFCKGTFQRFQRRLPDHTCRIEMKDVVIVITEAEKIFPAGVDDPLRFCFLKPFLNFLSRASIRIHMGKFEAEGHGLAESGFAIAKFKLTAGCHSQIAISAGVNKCSGLNDAESRFRMKDRIKNPSVFCDRPKEGEMIKKPDPGFLAEILHGKCRKIF